MSSTLSELISKMTWVFLVYFFCVPQYVLTIYGKNYGGPTGAREKRLLDLFRKRYHFPPITWTHLSGERDLLVEISSFPVSINPAESVWENFHYPTFGSIWKIKKCSIFNSSSLILLMSILKIHGLSGSWKKMIFGRTAWHPKTYQKLRYTIVDAIFERFSWS